MRLLDHRAWLVTTACGALFAVSGCHSTVSLKLPENGDLSVVVADLAVDNDDLSMSIDSGSRYGRRHSTPPARRR